jgi:hypothetical protein
MPAETVPQKKRRVRVTLYADLIETQEGTHLLTLLTGLGDPEVRVDAKKVSLRSVA